MASGEHKTLAGAHSECATAATVGSKDPSSFVEIAAAATAGKRDAATSNSSRTAAAATAGERDTETSRTTNRSPRTPTKHPRCIESERKETGVTAGNKRKTSVPVFLHRPGSPRLARGRTSQNVHNLVPSLPFFIRSFWKTADVGVQRRRGLLQLMSRRRASRSGS